MTEQNAEDTAGADDLVGLVLVSHSWALAQAAVALAQEMLHAQPVRIEVAAGLDETTFGTDAVAIQEAIERADSPAGVVVLMDLGSAVLSADLALEMLSDPSGRERVTLCPAPFVEGVVVAAVAAAGGADRDEVAAEARGALLAKEGQLGGGAEGGAAEDGAAGAADGAADERVAVFTVELPHGLHARPAARLVGEVRGLDATVRLRNVTTGVGPVPATSMIRVATLAAMQGHEVEVTAAGREAATAVERLVALAARRFDETDAAPVAAPVADEAPSRGPLPGAPGVAVGTLRRLRPAPVVVDDQPVADPATERRRLDEALEEVRREIEGVRSSTARDVGEEEAGIFDAHLSLLADEELLGDVRARVDTGDGAAAAWSDVIADVERTWAGLPDPYLRERAGDVRAVGDQVLRVMTGAAPARIDGEGVLVAGDLTPAETAGLDLALVAGVVLAHGSPTSHAAILARARDIPLVVAAGAAVESLPEGTVLALDGGTGEVQVDPSPEVLADFRRREKALEVRRTEELAHADEPAVTRDGATVEVAANLGSVEDARAAFAAGADGAGLVRTEFLFLGRDDAPRAAEQQEVYDAVAEAMGGRRITLRTLDVGGDKPLTYLRMPEEANPFLGLRGIRLSLEHPGLLREQLAAVCGTARRWPVSMMVPMVATPSELAAVRELLADAAGEGGVPEGLQVGTMIEVPAAALKIEAFVPHLDFVSIGTNDLTQYTLAAERGNGAVAALSDPLDPGVLRLIDQVCRAAHGRIDVAVCGEAGSDDLAIPVLVGLGVRELSVSPSAVPRVKAAVRELDVERCETLAAKALALPDADAVRELVRGGVREGATPR